jgi:chromosome segregation ATPase
MSTIGGGTAVSGYEQLSALLEFVKSPDYQKRVQDLMALESSAKQALAEAESALEEADTKSKDLAAAKAKHDAGVAKFTQDQAAHNARLTKIEAAIAQLQSALKG